MTLRTLCTTWEIPAYAQPHIHITTNSGLKLPVNGASGKFALSTNPKTLTVCWGDAPLTQLQCNAPSLDWDGQVRVGGFVTAIHMTQFPALDIPLAIITMEAQPLIPSVVPYLSAQQRASQPYAPPDFLDGIDDAVEEGVTTWIADVDSPFVGVLQDAMSQAHRVYAFGQLADEAHGWHQFFALPILLESVTLFMR